MRPVTADEIEAAARALVTAKETNLGIELTLPVVYPNGQLVTVAVTMESGRYLVHDAGFGAMYLTAAGVSVTKQLARRLAQLAGRYGCEFIGQRMQRRCEPEQIALAAAMVANASRTIGDQALEIRRQAESDFRAAVAERVRVAAGARVRNNETVKGKSGRSYRMPHIILDRSRSYPVAFVIALPSRSTVLTHFGEFWDIRGAHERVRNEAVYDENSDFKDEDRRLLSEVSEVIPFPQTAVRVAKLLEAA